MPRRVVHDLAIPAHAARPVAEWRERPRGIGPRHASYPRLINRQVPAQPEVGLADVPVGVRTARRVRVPPDAHAEDAGGEQQHERQRAQAGGSPLEPDEGRDDSAGQAPRTIGGRGGGQRQQGDGQGAPGIMRTDGHAKEPGVEAARDGQGGRARTGGEGHGQTDVHDALARETRQEAARQGCVTPPRRLARPSLRHCSLGSSR